MKPLSEMGRYATVVIDPPWPLEPIGWQRNTPTYFHDIAFETMSLDDIAELPIGSVMGDDSFVFCWTVARCSRKRSISSGRGVPNIGSR